VKKQKGRRTTDPQDQDNFPKIGKNCLDNHMRTYSSYHRRGSIWYNYQHGGNLTSSHSSILKRVYRTNKIKNCYKHWSRNDRTSQGLTPQKNQRTPNHRIETSVPNEMAYSISISTIVIINGIQLILETILQIIMIHFKSVCVIMLQMILASSLKLNSKIQCLSLGTKETSIIKSPCLKICFQICNNNKNYQRLDEMSFLTTNPCKWPRNHQTTSNFNRPILSKTTTKPNTFSHHGLKK